MKWSSQSCSSSFLRVFYLSELLNQPPDFPAPISLVYPLLGHSRSHLSQSKGQSAWTSWLFYWACQKVSKQLLFPHFPLFERLRALPFCFRCRWWDNRNNQVFFFVQFLFPGRSFPFTLEIPSRQGWFPLLRDWRGSKSVFAVILNAMVSYMSWAGMAERWVSGCFLVAVDPASKGRWEAVSMPDQVPSKHGLPGTWETRKDSID